MIIEMSVSEIELRNKLVTVARKVAQAGLVAGTWGNISARLDDKRVLITPSGISKEVLKPEDLLVVDLEGNVVKGNLKPSMETPMHTKIYAMRQDINAVVHTHSPYATAFAIAGKPLPVLTVDFAAVVGHEVPVTRYVRPGTREMADEVIKALGNHTAVLIRNHGIVAVGETLDDAFCVALLIEEEAKMYIFAKILGRIDILEKNEVRAIRDFYLRRYGQEGRKIVLRD